MKNKIIMLVLSIMLLMTVSACDSDMSVFLSGQDKISDTDKNESEDQNEENKKDEKDEQTVKVYFSDNQAMNLVEVEVDIPLSEGKSLEEKIIETLKSQPNDPEMFNAVGENIVVNSVKVEDKQAKVDLSGKDLSGGSTEETFLIDAIVSSLTALDTVDSVKFLVDGKEVETIMGHMETMEAFTRDDVTNNIITIDKTKK